MVKQIITLDSEFEVLQHWILSSNISVFSFAIAIKYSDALFEYILRSLHHFPRGFFNTLGIFYRCAFFEVPLGGPHGSSRPNGLAHHCKFLQ